MSNRTLIEINHDFAGDIELGAGAFVSALMNHLSCIPYNKIPYEIIPGVLVLGARHHSEPYVIEWGAYEAASRSALRKPDPAENADGDERFERGYYGHGRGLVVTQPEPGKFVERPMTPAELAARAPAWEIATKIFEIANYAGFAYIVAWGLIAPAIEKAIAEAVSAAKQA
jgi:hypothetical protein